MAEEELAIKSTILQANLSFIVTVAFLDSLWRKWNNNVVDSASKNITIMNSPYQTELDKIDVEHVCEASKCTYDEQWSKRT